MLYHHHNYYTFMGWIHLKEIKTKTTLKFKSFNIILKALSKVEVSFPSSVLCLILMCQSKLATTSDASCHTHHQSQRCLPLHPSPASWSDAFKLFLTKHLAGDLGTKTFYAADVCQASYFQHCHGLCDEDMLIFPS